MAEESTEDLVSQFQSMQQQMQTVLIQKESLKLQNLEIERALEELGKTDQKTAYKISGQIMISKNVEELKKELEETKETTPFTTTFFAGSPKICDFLKRP